MANEFYNAKDPPFNAVGDGVADDTAALQLAIDYAQGNHPPDKPRPLFIPEGSYKISAELVVTSHCHIFGWERFSTTPTTQIFCVNATQNAFHLFTNNVVQITDLAIAVGVGVTKTAGAAILAESVDEGGDRYHNLLSAFERLYINGHYEAIHLNGFVRCHLQSIHITNAERAGLVINNTRDPDGGLLTIDDLMFFGKFRTPGGPPDQTESYAAIHFVRGNGFALTKSALVGGTYGISVELLAGPTGSFFVQGCWIEEQSGYGIALRKLSTDPNVRYSNVVITGNEFTRLAPFIDGSQGAFRIFDGGGWIRNVIFNNNCINYSRPPDSAGVGLINILDGRNVQVCNNVIDFNGVIPATGIVVAAPTKDVKVMDNSFLNINALSVDQPILKYFMANPDIAIIRDLDDKNTVANTPPYFQLPNNAANGSEIYVRDGVPGTNPIQGGGTGAIARRINNVWVG